MQDYDVAISFAGQDRDTAEQLASELSSRGLSVFYDRDQQANLWGKDLYQHLADVYSSRARFCLVLVSQHYLGRAWTKHELSSAQSRAFQQDAEYILPVRLDDTELPGLPVTVGYLDLRQVSLAAVADAAVTKVRGFEAQAGTTSHNGPSATAATHRLSLPRSSVPAGDLERKRFVTSAFRAIAKEFESALRAAKAADSSIDYEFDQITTREFECNVYVAGSRRAGARIWHGDPMMGDAILYGAASRGLPGQGFNEMLTLIQTPHGLALRATMSGFDVQAPSDAMTAEDAASYLWNKMTRTMR